MFLINLLSPLISKQIPMIPLHFTFTLQDDSVVINCPTPALAFKYEVLSARLIIEKVKTIESFSLSFEKKLLQTPSNFLINNLVCRSYHIPGNSQKFYLSDMFSTSFCADYIYLVMTSQTSSMGNFTESPFNFLPWGLRSIKVTVNDRVFPSIPLDCSWGDQGNWIRAWLNLYSSSNENGGAFVDDGMLIDVSKFRRGYAIFRVDLNSSGCSDTLRPKLMSTARLQLEFMTATNPALRLYILSNSVETLQIDSQRSVLKNY